MTQRNRNEYEVKRTNGGKESISHIWVPVYLLLLIMTLPLFSGCRTVPSAYETAHVEKEIRSVIDQQMEDWNKGDIARFMNGYRQDQDTRFASGVSVLKGWNAVLERYRRTYPDNAAMGKLTFSEMDVTVISSDAALVFGHWHLQRENDEPSGLFTLLFRKTEEGWRIVHDHTSAAGSD